MLRKGTLFLTVCFFLTSGLQAATVTVCQNNSGQFSTLGDALSAAQPGDLILLGPGSYPESLVIEKSITIEATCSHPLTSLDGGHSQLIMRVQGDVDVVLRGLTFSNGFAEDAAALLIWQQANVTLEDCSFVNNHASGSNAVHVRHQGTTGSFFRCDFIQNECDKHSAALGMGFGARLLVEDCFFAHNRSHGVAGAVNCNSGEFDFRGNLFLDNTGFGEGALVIQGDATGSITNNTFHVNSGLGAVRINANTIFENNIITDTKGGPGLVSEYPELRSCNLYFNNESGPVDGSELGTHEFVGDPLYCDHPLSVFTLCELSTALEHNNDCGPMGALGEGCTDCGPVTSQQQTLNRIKTLYR